jgi:hypothetical protein
MARRRGKEKLLLEVEYAEDDMVELREVDGEMHAQRVEVDKERMRGR